MTKSTTTLRPGDKIQTTQPDGEDFGLQLVSPPKGKRAERVTRTVHNALHARGGMVVWFNDGTKTRPVHGRTSWPLA